MSNQDFVDVNVGHIYASVLILFIKCNKGYKCLNLQFCFSVTISKSNLDKEDNKLSELKLI